MKLLKLLEGLYQELKKYNEIEAQKEARKQKRSLLLDSHNTPHIPLTPQEGLGIKRMLSSLNIKYNDIALKANRSKAMVTQLLNGAWRSERVEEVLCKTLGYETFGQLREAAAEAAKGNTMGGEEKAEDGFYYRPAHLRASTNFIPSAFSWIRRQLANKNIKQRELAQKANCSRELISGVVCGERPSESVRAIIAEALGYASWKELWTNAVANSEPCKGGAA